ncbi:Pro-Pol polyprotein [Trichinella sp. T9]|nr:Pro-Pol polyprotein [Trichinella sp. T9]
MLSKRNVSKIKNDKIMRWKIELSYYDFDIIHRPGKDNVTPDALSRTFCSMASHDHCRHLQQLHDKLCHPGITRLYHIVRSKNLPYSIQEVRQVVTDCRTCAEMKPRFYQPETATLIKATQPFERLNIDFKGPLPGHQNQRYMFIVVEEYSRFPFAFPCADVSAASAEKYLVELFSLFGVPSYVHSDRGRTTPYNPQGNAQAERYTGIVWKTILLALKSQGLPTEQWPAVLPDALHAVRSLLFTSTNATPHERFLAFSPRSTSGRSIPAWLLDMEEVRLLEVNPTYAYVRFPDGRESSVSSTRHLAPAGSSDAEEAQQELHYTPRAGSQTECSKTINWKILNRTCEEVGSHEKTNLMTEIQHRCVENVEIEKTEAMVAEMDRIFCLAEDLEWSHEELLNKDDLATKVEEWNAFHYAVVDTRATFHVYKEKIMKSSKTETAERKAAGEEGKEPCNLRIPKWQLTPFDGDIMQFGAFWDQFQASVHSRTDLNDIEKFICLRSNLKGPALDVISGFSITATNYPEHHIIQLTEITKMTESSPTGLRKLYDKLMLHFRALRAMGKDPINGQLTTAEIFLAFTQRAMPSELNKKWEEFIE